MASPPSVTMSRRLWSLPAHLALAALIVLGISRLMAAAPVPAMSPQKLQKLPLAYGPASFSAAIALANGSVALGEERVGRRPQDWINQESYARALLGRARLTVSFDDLAVAGKALAIAKAAAVRGSGPLLTDAVYNFTVHRSAPISGDLDLIDHAAVRADPGDRAEVLALRGDVAFYAGDYDGAIDRYRAAAKLADGPGNIFRIALWQKKTSQPDAALASFARAAVMNRGRTAQFMANVYLQSGIVELERGNWPIADAWFRRADRTFPGYWLAQAHMVQMRAARGDVRGAEQGYLTIIARSGQPDVMDALAALYRSEGNAAASRQWADRSGAIWAHRLRQLPEAAYAHALEHELVLGSPAVALDLAAKNMRARPYGDSVTLLGWALLANGKPGDARDLLEKLNATPWQTAQQYVALSQAYAMLGDSNKSDTARAKALSLNPRATDPATPLLWFGHH